MLFIVWLVACQQPNCTQSGFDHTFIDGFIARSSDGEYTDIYDSQCGVRHGRAVCGDPDHWLDGLEVRQVQRGAECVLDVSGAIICPPNFDPITALGSFDSFAESWNFVCGVRFGIVSCAQKRDSSDEEAELVALPAFSPNEEWVDVTGWAGRLCGLDRSGRVACDPGLPTELELAGRWDRLQGGCAFKERGEVACINDSTDGIDSSFRDFPCSGVEFIDRGRGGVCFDAVGEPASCFNLNTGSQSNYHVGPRPSLEARRIGGYPRCGLEPGGFIVCGEERPGDIDDPDYVKWIHLP